MTDIGKRIAEIEELLEKATPGPWKYDTGNSEIEVENDRLPICRIINAYDRKTTFGEERPLEVPCDPFDDGEFIAASRAAIPFLLSQLKVYRQAIKEAREGLIFYAASWGPHHGNDPRTNEIIMETLNRAGFKAREVLKNIDRLIGEEKKRV